jgi:ribonuclease HI
MSFIELYTDGACRGNPGPGGFAWILRWNNYEKSFCKGFKLTTNNRMELMAVIDGLKAIRKKDIPVKIYTDSQYISRAVEEKWLQKWVSNHFRKTANKDLWTEFLLHYNPNLHSFHWIKGHSDNPFNNRCDQLAVWASLNNATETDFGYEELINDNKNQKNL